MAEEMLFTVAGSVAMPAQMISLEEAGLEQRADLQEWVRDCGFHCAGQSVPAHICDPIDQPDDDTAGGHTGHQAVSSSG